MKAIYTLIGDKYYLLKQDISVPRLTDVPSKNCVSSFLSVDNYSRSVCQNIIINTLSVDGLKTNKQLFNDMIAHLEKNEVTTINSLYDRYKVYVDYTMYEDGREIDHSALIQTVKPTDAIVPLGVATNNECVYRRVKTFNKNIEFKLRNMIPYGIMKNAKKKYTLKINNVCVFCDTNPNPEVHNSTYSTPYAFNSMTIQSSLEDMIMIFSSANEGIEFQETKVDFAPRTVEVHIEMLFDNLIVAYDKREVDKVIEKNISNKYPDVAPDPGDDPDEGGGIIPPKDEKPDADGNFDPDANGYSDWYEKCEMTTPKALLVVEDAIPDSKYDVVNMIKISKVIADVPDIQVGEYVVYRESLTEIIE